MKKTNFIIFLTCITLFIGIADVKATFSMKYNGTGVEGTPSGNACYKPSSSNLCVYNNKNHATIRVTLVQYNDGVRTQIGHAVYYTNSNYNISKVGVLTIKGQFKTESTDGYIQQASFFSSGNNISSSKLESYYVQDSVKHALDTIHAMDVPSKYESIFKTKKTFVAHLADIKANKLNIKYRLIIEPVYSFYTGSKMVYYTTKGVAKDSSIKDLTKEERWCELTGVLYTETKDIGISKGKYLGTVDSCGSESKQKSARNLLKDEEVGSGYNIVDFSKKLDVVVETPKCDYNNSNHFKKNVSGDASPTDTKGSGPNGENCCNLDYTPSATKQKILTTYKNQYKEANGGKTISTKDFKKIFYIQHPECLEPDPPEPVETEASCTGSSEAIYDQGASESEMIATLFKEKGETTVNGSSSQYVRKTIGSYGKILCSENLKLSLPTNYKNEVGKGSLIEWPTYENGLRLNMYPLTLQGTANCTLVINQLAMENAFRTGGHWEKGDCKTVNKEDGTCEEYDSVWKDYPDTARITAETNRIITEAKKYQSNPSSLYNLSGKFYVKYNDTEYGGTFPLEKYYNYYPTPTGFSFSSSGGSFTIKQTVKYKIPQSTYRYIIKNGSQATKSVNSLPSGSNNYIDVGYGNLPVSNDAKKGNYNISILYNRLGGFSSFKFATNTTSYNCSYTVDDNATSCECPSGTAAAGKDLTTCQAGGCDGKTYLCEDAKKKFCDTKCECETGQYKGKDLSSYVSQGMTCSNAQASYCSSSLLACPSGTDFENQPLLTPACNNNYNCKMLTCNVYICPSKYTYSGKKLNSLIANYLVKNPSSQISSRTVMNEIYNLYCDGDSSKNNENIIYRVIELANPFPGYSGNGRNPGYNWDGADNVKKYITNNRNVNTNKIYNKSNVMYHFKLTPSTIKKIRSYNSNNEYADFKLTCKASNGRNCISDFVHNSEYGIQGDSKCYTTGSFTTCR